MANFGSDFYCQPEPLRTVPRRKTIKSVIGFRFRQYQNNLSRAVYYTCDYEMSRNACFFPLFPGRSPRNRFSVLFLYPSKLHRAADSTTANGHIIIITFPWHGLDAREAPSSGKSSAGIFCYHYSIRVVVIVAPRLPERRVF